MKRKLKMLLMLCCCILLCAGMGVQVKAEENNVIPLETNGQWVNGSADSEIKCYAITLPSDGRLKFRFQSKASWGCCTLMDTGLSVAYASSLCCSGTEKGPETKDRTVDLAAGTYCLRISDYNEKTWTGAYGLWASFEPAGNNETEPNDSFDTAMDLPGNNQQVTGFLWYKDDYDFYKFELAQEEKVSVEWSAKSGCRGCEVSVWDADQVCLQKKESSLYVDDGKLSIPCGSYKAGTYYIRVNGFFGSEQSVSSFEYRQNLTGEYTVKYTLEPKITSPSEDSGGNSGSSGSSNDSSNTGNNSTGNSGSNSSNNPGSGSTGNPGSSSSNNPGSGSTGNPGSSSSNNPGSGSTGSPGSTNTNQGETEAPAKLTVSTKDITANASGVLSRNSVSVNSGNKGFSVYSDSEWLTVSSSPDASKTYKAMSAANDGTLYLFADKNETADARVGKITLTHSGGLLTQTITVKQDKLSAVLIVDATEKTADRTGKFFDSKINVKTQKTGGCKAEVQDADWLWISAQETDDITKGITSLNMDGDGTFYLVAAENTGNSRTAKVVVTHSAGTPSKTITVTQKGIEGAYITVDRETVAFDEPKESTSGSVQIHAEEDTRWTAKASDSWIKFLESENGTEKYVSLEGIGGHTFYIYVDANGTYEDREGTVTISSPGLEDRTIVVTQEKNERDLKTLLEETTVTVSRKTFKKGKSSKVRFIFPEGLYASDVSRVQYSCSKKKVAVIDKNGVIKAKRKGKATIEAAVTLVDGSSKTFKFKITVGKRTVNLKKK